MKINDFYHEEFVTQEVLRCTGGVYEVGSLAVSSADVFKDTVPAGVEATIFANVQKLYESMQKVTIILDGETYTFEIAHLPQGDGTDSELTISTYSSSLDNAGNAYEVALAAYLHTNRSYTYIASPGNGGSTPLNVHEDTITHEKERRYYAENGTMLVHDENNFLPLPTVRALHIALDGMGIKPTRISSNSAGAILATAYGSTYGDSINSLHQNVRTNIFDISKRRLLKGMMYEETTKNGPLHTRTTNDPLSVPKWDEQSKLAKEMYYPKDITPKKSKAMLIANARAFTHGPNNGDPMLKDLQSFARKNPEVNILFTNGEHDPLLGDNDYLARMGNVAVELSKITSGRVSAALIKDVSHGPHTFYPQYVHALVDQVE